MPRSRASTNYEVNVNVNVNVNINNYCKPHPNSPSRPPTYEESVASKTSEVPTIVPLKTKTEAATEDAKAIEEAEAWRCHTLNFWKYTVGIPLLIFFFYLSFLEVPVNNY
jgi:hypothetical protein